MSDLYSIIPGLQPTAQELLEAELLCKQILEAKFPDLELREGTGLRDLVLRPSALLLALINKATNYYFTQNSLKGIDDSTPSEILDNILSNWFLTRNMGTRSVISARLYFARKKNISVSSDTYFSTDNTSKFFPLESISYSAESLSYDSYSNEYYVDIDLNAEKEGVQYNVSSGSLLYFANFDPYFLRAEINYLKEESIVSETNSEFINRSKTSISTRNLINAPSIDARLKEAFNYINRLLTVGMGDPEMIRDQIKAVFDEQPYRLVSQLNRLGTTVKVYLSNHGYNTGQKINVINASPSEYNGTYSIVVINNSEFTYQVTTTPSEVTFLPSINSINVPIYIHNGGMVDIYCSDKLATSNIQLTMDDFGRANLTGPIYDVRRSTYSAGDELDTVPLDMIRQVQSVSTNADYLTITTTVPHLFKVTDKITIKGAFQGRQLTSLTSSGIVASAVLSAHGYVVGDNLTIIGALPAAYSGSFIISRIIDQNSFQFLLKGPIYSAAYGEINGIIYAEVNLVNGSHSLSLVTLDSFTFQLPRPIHSYVGGNITASTPTKFSIIHENTKTIPLDRISSIDGEVTLNVSNHGFSIGRYVTITGCQVSSLNGSWVIKEILNADQIKFDRPGLYDCTSTTGFLTYVIPWLDTGFSQKQVLVIDFGIALQGQTASLEIDYIQNLNSIQAYLDSPVNRVLCADYLAKGFNFYKLNVEVTSYSEVAPDINILDETVKNYLKSIAPGENFIMSDMVSKIASRGIINIQNPPRVTYKKYTRDLTPIETGLITDILDPNDKTSVFLLDNVSTFAKNINTTNTPYII